MATRKKAEAAQPEPQPQQAVPEPKQEPRVLTMAPAPQPGSAFVVQAPPSPDEVLEVANNQIKIRKGYVKLVAASLRPEDVLVFGEEVYLPAKPCQDILSWARIRVKPHWPVQEQRYASPDGDFLEFIITATIMDTGGREVDVMGNRSTRDEFFGLAGKDYVCPTCKGPLARRYAREGDKWESSFCDVGRHGKVKPEVVQHWLPLYDIDIPSVRSAAVTNLWNKSLKAIGLMPTIQDLADAGMDISKVKRVDFKGERKPAQSQAPANPPKQSTPPASPTPNPQKGAASPSPQSNQAKPSEAQRTGPPKAVIPDKAIAGTLDEIKPGTTVPKDKATGKPTGKPGTPFLSLIVSGARVNCFDNRELAMDTRGTKRKAFDLLMDSLGEWVVLAVKKSGQWDNVTAYERIGRYEWDSEGVPILRRESPVQTAVPKQEPGDTFEFATDDDIPF